MLGEFSEGTKRESRIQLTARMPIVRMWPIEAPIMEEEGEAGGGIHCGNAAPTGEVAKAVEEGPAFWVEIIKNADGFLDKFLNETTNDQMELSDMDELQDENEDGEVEDISPDFLVNLDHDPDIRITSIKLTFSHPWTGSPPSIIATRRLHLFTNAPTTYHAKRNPLRNQLLQDRGVHSLKVESLLALNLVHFATWLF